MIFCGLRHVFVVFAFSLPYAPDAGPAAGARPARVSGGVVHVLRRGPARLAARGRAGIDHAIMREPDAL